MSPATSVFHLPQRLIAKGSATLIGADERQFASIETTLEQQTSQLTGELEKLRLEAVGRGRRAWIATWRSIG